MVLLLVEIINAGIDFSREGSERKLYNEIYEKGESLVKFKELLTNHLPEPLLIVDTEDAKHLFNNEAF